MTSHAAGDGTSTSDYIDRLHARLKPHPIKLISSMKHGSEDKYVTVQFDPKQYKSIELIHITDVQFGHLAFKRDRFLEFREWILRRPNRFVLLGGDMVDAATVISVSSPYENTEEPQSQIYKFAELCVPMRHRIIGSVGGNHERRGVKTFGDLGKMIAALLKIPYSAGHQFIDIYFGDHKPFKVNLWHGRGAARSDGGQMNMMTDYMRKGDSHLFLVGHLHGCQIKIKWRKIRDGKGGIRLEKYAGVMSSSFLDFWGGYAEVSDLDPSDTMMGRTILEPDGGWEITLR